MAREPIHPGQVLEEDFMQSFGLDARQLGEALKVPPASIEALVAARAPMTADLALRLERYFGVSARSWMNLQVLYDLDQATASIGSEISRGVTPRAA
jgi:antitoxin HigA-1